MESNMQNSLNFKMLLEKMISDNSLTESYQELVNQNPVLVVQYLIQFIHESPNSKLSQFSIILLSRLISVLFQNFLSIGNKEFHDFVIKNVFIFLKDPNFTPYTLSLIEDLIPRLVSVYSNLNGFNTNAFFFPLIMEAIQSQSIHNSYAAINTLTYCISNESLNYHQLSDPISQFLRVVFTNELVNLDIMIPILRLLYLTFDSISFDFRSFLPNIFIKIQENVDLLNQSIHDMLTYISTEKYSFFGNISKFFILFYLNILSCENMPNDLEYCSLEMLYNFSISLYHDVIDSTPSIGNIANQLFLFLSNYETNSKESKFIISELAKKYGNLVDYSVSCYDILEAALKNVNSVPLNKLIAAIRLFSYSYEGIFIHLSIRIPDIICTTIVQSGVIDNQNQLVRLAAFDMLSSFFKVLSNRHSDFDPNIILPKMIQTIENPDIPIILTSKYKAFYYYLKIMKDDALANIIPSLQIKLLQLTQKTTPEQLVYILRSIEVILSNNESSNFQNIKQFFLNILQSPTSVPFNIYIIILQLICNFDDIANEVFIAAFSYILSADFEILTGKDLHMISVCIYNISHDFPQCAIHLFHPLIKFAINGAMKDVEYSSMPFQKVTSMLNLHTSTEKQNNIIKTYNGSQIQLIIFYLKVLRYILLIRTQLPQDIIKPYEEIIFSLLLKWSSINFSDKIQYNALKTVHIFFCLTRYEVPFGQLIQPMINFTNTTTQPSRLRYLYHSLSRIVFGIVSLNKMSEELLNILILFYINELKKVMENREHINDQLKLGDCDTYPEDAKQQEEFLSLILLPFLTNPAFKNIDLSQLVNLSMNINCVTSISFLINYFASRERKIEIFTHLVQIFMPPTDQDEVNKYDDPFFFMDSKYTGLLLMKMIDRNILSPEEISLLLNLFCNRGKIEANKSIFIGIIILILDKYRSANINFEILNLLLKINNFYYFMLENSDLDIVLKSWNNIFELLCKQTFNEQILTRLLGILIAIKDILPENVFDLQRNLLLQNFKGNIEQLNQMIELFTKRENPDIFQLITN